MKYRVTCLTPTLVGNGERLSPIDYMVWKDHVNVLDQSRIFRLLSKSPRLEGYLAQLKKAEKLDFASWGGFAQNFAGRRIPFESPGVAAAWERTHAEHLFIPTFASGASGPYLPGTALKGALRTGSVFDRWSETTLRDLANRLEDRVPRNVASKAEDSVLGAWGASRMKALAVSDSAIVPYSQMKVYLLRVAALAAKGSGKMEISWKSVRGSVDSKRVDDATPEFAEMCMPGAVFEGPWRERSAADRAKMFQASNRYAEAQLARHTEYAQQAGLGVLASTLVNLTAKLSQAASSQQSCLLSIGWGGGLLSKSAYLKTDDENYRSILRKIPAYERAIRTGMPFPKTRRVIFENGQPANLPGWVLLEVI